MRIFSKRSGVAAGSIALVAALTVTLAGCAGGSNSGGNSAIITVNGSEPQNPLIPTNTNETGGGKIVDSIFAGLVYYDAKGAPVNEIADSITSEDNTVWTIKIKDNYTFTNGEKVTSDSFIDAWNYGALFSTAQLNSYFFDVIEGFSYEEDSELTGLAKVSDTEFTVTLSAPASDFPLRLGYTAFMPLPKVFFDDPAAFGENPVSNGPYMVAEAGWKHNEKISLVTNPDYKGGRKPVNGGIDIVFYASEDAAYADLLSDNLDVLDAVPSNALATFKTDLGDRAVQQAAAIFQSFTIPATLEHFAANKEGNLRRQAISLAINRPEITDVIFEGTREPARDFTSPVINGWSGDVAGSDVLDFNADKAKKLWAEADALSPWTGSFQIAYNSDGGHQGWVDAVTNSIKNTLGIDASGAPYSTFKELRTNITDRTITTAFRTGWQGDYPALANFLEPIYKTGAGSNDGDYSNKDVDALFEKGNSAATLDEANGYYQKAQEILFKDLPAVPLWYGAVSGGYSTLVKDVVFGWNSQPLFYQITKG